LEPLLLPTSPLIELVSLKDWGYMSLVFGPLMTAGCRHLTKFWKLIKLHKIESVQSPGFGGN
jgi:hypothetical protein